MGLRCLLICLVEILLNESLVVPLRFICQREDLLVWEPLAALKSFIEECTFLSPDLILQFVAELTNAAAAVISLLFLLKFSIFRVQVDEVLVQVALVVLGKIAALSISAGDELTGR